MAGPRTSWRTRLLLTTGVAVLLTGASPWPFSVQLAWAAQLQPRSMQMSDSRASHTNTTYRLQVRVATTGLVGSIAIEFCGNSPLIGEVCTPPTGFDATNAALTGEAGMTGFTVSTTSTANTIILTRPP